MAQFDAAFWTSLKPDFRGEVETDIFTRGRYATDASIYQAFPAAVTFPQSESDVQSILSRAHRKRIPVTARGGGTSTAGQAVSEGVILDFRRHLNALVGVDPTSATCVAQPGITLSALNAALAPHGLRFPVAIPSSRQATLGGMLANNTRGLRVLRHGAMADNVLSARAILAEGDILEFGVLDGETAQDSRLLDLLQLGELHEKEIKTLWPEPKSKPAPSGYNLRAILPSREDQNFAHLLAGSEGTLAVVTELRLKLAPRKRNTGLGVCRFADVQTALKATPAIVALGASVVELLERRQLRVQVAGVTDRFLHGDAFAFLLVEFDEENPVENTRRLKELDDLLAGLGRKALGVGEVLGRQAQNAVWRMYREAVAADLRFQNSARPIGLIEDAAIPVERLADYHASVTRLFNGYGLSQSVFGGAGSGCIQIRPLLDLSQARDVDRMRGLSGEIIELVRKFGGSITGGYGLGLARSELSEAIRGPVASNLCAQVKAILDPRGILNPGKIVGAPRFDDPALFRRTDLASGVGRTALVWDDDASAKAAQDHAGHCSGLALCLGTPPKFSCPSEAVTKAERDGPRGRANSVRLARTGLLGEDAFGSSAMVETMRLCVSCKACRSACPSSIDIAKMKSDVLSAARSQGRRLRADDLYARLPIVSEKIQPWRRFVNLRDWIPGLPRLSERITGFSADRTWPRFSGRPFSPGLGSNTAHRGEVALFGDTFNQSFEPANLRAAANVLQGAGYRVSLLTDGRPGRGLCCGRTFYDAGYIAEARAEAERLLTAVAGYVERGIPVVGLEAACALMLRDEYAALGLQAGPSQTIILFEEFIARLVAGGDFILPFKTVEADCVLQPHCHERALDLQGAAETALKTVPGLSLRTVKPTCCGFNGMVGLTPETLEPSLAMAELALFPAIRKAGRDALVAATGFSCRRQIHDGLGVTARHPAMILDLALKSVSEIVA